MTRGPGGREPWRPTQSVSCEELRISCGPNHRLASAPGRRRTQSEVAESASAKSVLLEQLAILDVLHALAGAAGDRAQHAPRLTPRRRLDIGTGGARPARQPIAQPRRSPAAAAPARAARPRARRSPSASAPRRPRPTVRARAPFSRPAACQAERAARTRPTRRAVPRNRRRARRAARSVSTGVPAAAIAVDASRTTDR